MAIQISSQRIDCARLSSLLHSNYKWGLLKSQLNFYTFIFSFMEQDNI